MATIPSTDEFLTSLAVLVTSDAGGEMTAETLGAVITAAGGKPNAAYTALFAGSIAKTGIEKMTAAPGSAGGGGGGGGGGAAEAAVEEEKPEEEEMVSSTRARAREGASGSGAAPPTCATSGAGGRLLQQPFPLALAPLASALPLPPFYPIRLPRLPQDMGGSMDMFGGEEGGGGGDY
jgi:large subunit ribosomal protein LP1